MANSSQLHSSLATEEPNLPAANGDSPRLKAQREALRRQGKAKLQAALESTTALTSKDYESYRKEILSDEGLERGGATTGQKKLDWLQENVNRHIPNVISDVRRLEQEFFNKLSEAKRRRWITAAGERRWQERLASDSVLWHNKKVFLTEKFPKYFENWQQLAADETSLRKKVEQLHLTKKDIPELAPFLDPTFIDNKYSAKKVIVDNALAAVGAFSGGKQKLHSVAEAILVKAVNDGVLAPNKVSEWLRRIFAKGHDDTTINKFLAGEGKNPLSALIRQWADVKNRYDKVEAMRQQKPTNKFHFVTTDQFLNWHYDARLAYVNEAERQLNSLQERSVILGDIRRELDMQDWSSAEALIQQAESMHLSAKELADVRSMRRYMETQRLQSPQPVIEGDPQQDMYRALAELKGISGPMYDLYSKAIARGYGTVSALTSLMYNRCWTRKHKYLDGSTEITMRDRAKEETKEVVEHGHTRGYENNYIPGWQSAAIREHDDGIWAPQLLHLGDDESARAALVNKCESQQNSHSFKYWTTQIPENVSYEHHQYIVYNLNWRIKQAMRAGPVAENIVHRNVRGGSSSPELSLSLAA